MTNKESFFKQLNSVYCKIYVVTIARAIERHEVIKQELNGLNFDFFYGADFQNLNVNELSATGFYNEELSRKNHRYNKPLKGGMLGCSISHKMVYEEMIKNNLQKILILEDDVFVNDIDFNSHVKALEELPNDWDLLYYDYNKNEVESIFTYLKKIVYHIQKFFGGIKFSHRAINNLYATKFSENLMHAGLHDFTNAYAITLEGAKKLNQIQTPVQWFPDHLLAFACTNKLINGFCLRKKAFYQTSQTSNKEQSLINSTSY